MGEPATVQIFEPDAAAGAALAARLRGSGLELQPSDRDGPAPALAIAGPGSSDAECVGLRARWPHTGLIRVGGDLEATGVSDAVRADPDRPEFVELARALAKLGRAEIARARTIGEINRFAALIPQMAWITDPNGHALWFNARWYDYTGADAAHIAQAGSGKAWYHPEDADGARGAFLDAVRREAAFEGEFRIRRRDGAYRWFLSRAEPMRDPDGRILRWFGTHTDISERREAEAALRMGEAAQRALIASLPQLVWTADSQGSCDYLSPQWSAYTGHPAQALLGLGWADLALHPDDRTRFGAHWRQAVTEAGAHSFSFEYRLKRHDGVWRWFGVRGRAISDAEGRVLRWLGASTDIHEAVEAREALKAEADANARELQRLHELSQDLFSVSDLDGALLATNPAWSRRLGWSRAELAGMNGADLFHPDDLKSARACLHDLRTGAGAAAFEARVLARDGDAVWVAWTSVVEGALVYTVGRDVTERRRAAEELEAAQAALRQAQKMEAIGQLTGGVAHDFNNLLTAITGNLELLQRRLAKGRTDVDGFAEGAMAGARRAATLTQRLLAFARRSALAPARVEVNGLIGGLEDLLRRTVGEGVQVATSLAAGLPDVWCDPNQLENAVVNLVINARDAMPEGGVLTIETAESVGGADLPPGRYVRVTVRDTGVGMAREVAERAFDPFFTTKPIGHGTGLGLSQIYGFATQSGGRAEIESAPGAGSAVSIHLPHRKAPAAVAAPPPAPAHPTPARAARGEHVLVVEDEPDVRAMVERTLADAGYRVTTAADGEAGLERVRASDPIDLLLTDIGLPGLNGRRLAEAARVARPGIRVLFVTGYEHEAGPGGAEHPDEGPGADLLSKPFELEVLLARVAALLDAPADFLAEAG